MPDAAVTLRVAGQNYAGWKSATVTRSIEQMASSFSLGLSDRFTEAAGPLPVSPGDSCELYAADEKVISGYVDVVDASYSATDHTYSVQGRSRAGDLVDCTTFAPEQYGQDLAAIARTLAAPFGLSVRTECDIGATFATFNPDRATAHAALERACRQRGVLLTSDTDGTVVLTQPGKGGRVATPIMLGGERGNVLDCRATFRADARFSEIHVGSQNPAWDENADTMVTGANAAVARDPNVKRYRPLAVEAETTSNGLTLPQRAKFEINTRAGRAKRLSYTVQGWRHQSGLWQPNTLARVIDSRLGVDVWLLIVQVSHTLDDGGMRTEITLAPQQAYSVLVEPGQEFGALGLSDGGGQ